MLDVPQTSSMYYLTIPHFSYEQDMRLARELDVRVDHANDSDDRDFR